MASPEPNGALPRFPRQKLFTVALRCGRLANRLILFANIIALAEEQGHRLINFTFHSYSEFFEGTRRNIYCQYPAPKRRSWLDLIPGVATLLRKSRIPYRLTRLASRLNERFTPFGSAVVTLREVPGCPVMRLDGAGCQAKIRDAKVVFVYGWHLCAPGLVQKHADAIRTYFRPVEKYEIASRRVVERLRLNADVVIGVHVRHGDYRVWRGGRCFFPASRYAAWMQDLAAQFLDRKVAFLVCSDEPRHGGEFPGLVVEFGADGPVADIYALARCDYIFGPKSTFSLWASFYGGKPLWHIGDRSEPAKLESFRVACLDWDEP